jgi:tight adherence protein B
MRRAIWTAAAATVVGFLLAGPAAATTAGNGHGPSVSGVNQSGSTLRLVFSAGDLAPGEKLDPASVHLTLNGTSVPAAASVTQSSDGSKARLPVREAIMVLDVSGSMKGSGIAAARSAALAYAAGMPADVRIGLVTFSDTPRIVLTATTDRAALRTAIEHVQAGGDTALYDGIIAAATAASAAPADAQLRLLVLSDGDDTGSKHSVADATAAVAHDRLAVDAVKFRFAGGAGLDAIAANSGGRVLPATSAGDLSKAFSNAAQAFTAQALVSATVPEDLAGKRVTLVASMRAGARIVTAPGVTVQLLGAAAAPAPKPTSQPQHRPAGAPATHTSSLSLRLSLGITFVALIGLILLALWIPLETRDRRRRQARLDEISRYRLAAALAQPPAPSQGRVQGTSSVAAAALSVADKAVRARGKRQQIVDALDRAGLRMRAEEWVVLQLSAVVVAGALVALLFRSPIGLPVGAVVGYLATRAFLAIKTSKRSAAFDAALPDMLQLLAGSVRSGFSLNQAVAGVVSEGTEPVASEFARALTEVRLGADLEDALDQVADRMNCLDLHLVLLAVRISREVGGNLAEVLMTTSTTMRERAHLKGQVKTLSAEGRISAKILIALPFAMAGFMALFRRQYLHPLISTGLGWALLATGGVLLGVGAFWINRIVKIEV